MIPSPTELNYFNEVCQTLNLSRASERLGISQPTLSAAIKRLEKNIGVALFIRNKKGVVLTKAGLNLQAHSNTLLSLWHSLKTESLASTEQVQGHFSIGCHPSVAMHALPAVLATLLAQYPNLELTLKHDLSRKILEGIVNLRIDLGIVVNPIHHPDLILQKLYEDEVGFWGIVPDQLAFENNQHPTFICDIDLHQTQFLLKAIEKQGISNYRLLKSSNLNVIAHLCAHQCGIGILPKSVALANHKNSLVNITNTPTYQDEMYLVYRPDQRYLKALHVIVQTIKAQFLNAV